MRHAPDRPEHASFFGIAGQLGERHNATRMSHDNLAVYLNDHLAGATGLLELLEHVQNWYAGTDLERSVAALHAEISEDRQVLMDLMERLNISKSVPRRVAGWLAEKAAQLKLKIDDPAAQALRLLESMEAASLGIEGKRLLWVSLSAAAEKDAALRGTDYQKLEQRAADQRVRVERVRVTAAQAGISSDA